MTYQQKRKELCAAQSSWPADSGLVAKKKSHPEAAFPILRPEHSHFNGSQADDNP